MTTLDNLLEDWKTFQPRPPRIKGFAFLLYSSMDQNIAGFVEGHTILLDRLTGSDFDVFILAPAIIDLSYDVAGKFGVYKSDLPCIVFFQDMQDTQVLVYPLDAAWDKVRLHEEFEAVATDVQRAQKEAGKITAEDEAKWRKAMAAFWKGLTKRIKSRRRNAKVISLAQTVYDGLKKIKELLN